MFLGQGVAGPAQLFGDALLTPHSGLLGVCVGLISAGADLRGFITAANRRRNMFRKTV
jgi:hypothetical protein